MPLKNKRGNIGGGGVFTTHIPYSPRPPELLHSILDAGQSHPSHCRVYTSVSEYTLDGSYDKHVMVDHMTDMITVKNHMMGT